VIRKNDPIQIFWEGYRSDPIFSERTPIRSNFFGESTDPIRSNIFGGSTDPIQKYFQCADPWLEHTFSLCRKLISSDEKSFWRKTKFCFDKIWQKKWKILTKNILMKKYPDEKMLFTILTYYIDYYIYYIDYYIYYIDLLSLRKGMLSRIRKY
jgi:hypothetical protein